MGFFSEFNAWLNVLLARYVELNTARVAAALEPAVVTLATIYIMAWGYLHLMGKIDEPFGTGLKRIITLVVVFGVALRLWFYNGPIVDTFFNAPADLAAAIIGAPNAIGIVDQIFYSGSDVAEALLSKGGILNGSISYILAGFAVYLVIGITAIYTAFLLTLSRIALSVLLAIGPLFITMLLFDSTRRFFEAWIAQLATYGLITILTVLTVALLMHLLSTASADAAAAGPAIQIAQAMRVCLAGGLILLVLLQVMSIAAHLANGFALQSYGAVQRTVGWGLRGGRASVKLAGRAMFFSRPAATPEPPPAEPISATP